ncbi:hypothetical protein [Ammoniphilus oxalaticus]|nr:hypothetical protein [Ammoniphilus oxalaticus]
MNKLKTNLFRIAKSNSTYWILLLVVTAALVGFYYYLRHSVFH